MRLIIDTNVYFSALIFDREVLKTIDYCHRNFHIFTSPSILLEIEKQLFGPRIRQIYKGYSRQLTEEFFAKIVNESTRVLPIKKVIICRDPKDNMFLELAQAAQADYLITGDKDLLTLEHFEQTKILKPSEFMAEINNI